MFDSTLDIILSVILAICAILLLSGRGRVVLNLFRGGSDKAFPYEEKKLSISMGICCVVMFLSEMAIIFLADYTWVIIASLIAVVASFVIAIWYLRKYAKVEPEKKDSISKKVKDLQRKK